MRKSGMTFWILLQAALVIGVYVLLLHFFPDHPAVCTGGFLLLTAVLLIRRHSKRKEELQNARPIFFTSDMDPENDGEIPADEERKGSENSARAEAQKKEKSSERSRNGNTGCSKDEGYLGIGLDSVEEEVFFWDDDD